MKRVRIRAVRVTTYPDLMVEYENPMENACDVSIGDSWISYDAQCPEGFCYSAWETLKPFVSKLAEGEGHFFGNWMKNPYSAMLSCNDGFRPVTFLVETMENED